MCVGVSVFLCVGVCVLQTEDVFMEEAFYLVIMVAMERDDGQETHPSFCYKKRLQFSYYKIYYKLFILIMVQCVIF